jgi:hypothetical protein
MICLNSRWLFTISLACIVWRGVSTAQEYVAPTRNLRTVELPDLNQGIYYKNKLELTVDTGLLPVNIPFVFDFLVDDQYYRNPLSYTLVPVIAGLRWHVNNVGGPWIFRGNTDVTFALAATAIPRGPETHYVAFNLGLRRNFVRRNWKATPYTEARGGVGMIDAKGPKGVLYAQGQDLTFTLMLGSGVRYNLNSRYSLEAGVSYMHVSNAYLSQPRYEDFGINVYGPVIGLNIRLGK